MGAGGQRHVAAALPPGKSLDTHRTSGCIGPIDGLDGCENLFHTGNRSPDHPALSELLCRLRYSSPKCKKKDEPILESLPGKTLTQTAFVTLF